MAETKTEETKTAEPTKTFERPKNPQADAGTIKKAVTHLHFLSFAAFFILMAYKGFDWPYLNWVFAGVAVLAVIAYYIPPRGLDPETLGAIPVYQSDLDAEIAKGVKESEARVKAKKEAESKKSK
mmetsp:Transcript_10656/g.16317  ORF Transcript_10656/g.16317 Transcript_10656/m.16317 type:complete len:125 (+) Transcript_10656:243-617(+)|eukprot:CAMPEP_0178898112 /NCGR_PEP_ID=MMETSP0786-20121207/2141_1 /TAXON_ID=186022 /ORGANISM="Thalassionema frauenfeldii, Strain CCMP 1798" /LENGTH=124 /DNA_ID=CAMNT_0020568777 /DNA_START=142 /DNA_END=516 /DNA_ORIENTATION=+